ncbi:MAG: DNA/RNA non-specific endonuclease [Spirochaetota bacterium]|nr:DNA/RNA non-specific endonuclease [Spirochaetota bacterium]
MATKKQTTTQTRKVTKAKKRGKRLLLLLALVVVLWLLSLVFAPSEDEYLQSGATYIVDLELPAYDEGEIVVRHPGFTLLYDEEHEQARWVAYHLTRDELYGTAKRKDNFRADPSIPTGSAELADYRGSGYDRGHLIPAGDLTWSDEAMSASFFLSNMSPQDGSFNRGIWSQLEAVVRNFADTEGAVYVVTGPVLTDGPYQTIGANEVSVPNSYYKVILDYEEPELKAIGFVLPNEGSKSDLKSFATTVREVEDLTGLDFFHRLPDMQEELLETRYDTEAWDFSPFTASEQARQAYESGTVHPAQTESGTYRLIKGTLDTVLVTIKRESRSLIELFIPRAQLKTAVPFLY